MDTFVDVRNTELAEAHLRNLYMECCKISHLRAMARLLQAGRDIPEGVQIIRPEPGSF